MPRPLSPECQLVFRTADPACTPLELAPVVEHVSDWMRVVAIAEREAATIQLARALIAIGEGVPGVFLNDIRRRALAIELRMQYLARRTQQTCASLADRDIPFMLLKGAAVGALVDPTFCWRPMTDVDILVKPEDADRASEAIVAAGWTPSPDPVLRGLLADAHHLPPFIDPNMPGIRVELHVSHLPARHPFTFQAATLWPSAQRAQPPFAGALLPSMEHLVLHAAVHFAWQHPMSFGAWRTFRLVAAVTALPGFDWNSLTTTAVNARAGTALYWTLRLATRLSGIAIPPQVLSVVAPPTPEWILAALERHFIANIAFGEMPASPSVRLDHALWLAAIRPRWSGHRSSRHWDHENQWARAFGRASTESGWNRVVRHVAGYRRWTAFFTRTLAG